MTEIESIKVFQTENFWVLIFCKRFTFCGIEAALFDRFGKVMSDLDSRDPEKFKTYIRITF